MRKWCCLSCGLLLVLTCTLSGHAAPAAGVYPARPVRFIVPFPPGGGNDTVARVVAQKLAESLGQGVVIDNRGGGGGNIGIELAARAVPDGHTLALGSFTTLVINPNVYTGLAFDPGRSFAGVGQLASSALVMVVNANLPVKSVRELVARVKAQPGRADYAAGSTAGQLAGELFKATAGVDLLHIPYKGNAQALTDVIGGQVPVFFGGLLAAQPHVRTGRLRALGVTSRSRSPALADVPTIAEAGLPGYELDSWYGVIAPRGTPRDVITRLNGELTRIVALAEVREQLLRQGAAPASGTPEQFEAYIRAELVRWSPLIRKANVQPE